VAQMKDHHALDEVCAAVVYLHGRAGDLAAKRRGETGMTAGDLLNELPAAIQTIHEDPGPFGIVR
jgi:NAD(P)H-hydrate epimerase